MRMTPAISMLAGALIALSSGAAIAKSDKVQRTGNPPHASNNAMDVRSSNASTRGANQKKFCPPGQAKKAGKGSSFNC